MAQPLPARPEARGLHRRRRGVLPSDFAVFVRYDFDFLHKIPARHPSPPALTLKELDEFLSQANDRYRVAWLR
jgi:hypothetical protein